MREVDTNTFFTNTKSITLDSIYFQAGSRVQCAARAFNANGDAGLELVSSIVVISKEEGKKKPAEIYRQNTGCRIIWFSWPYLLQVCVSLVSRVLLELNLSLQRFATRVQMIQTFPTSSNWQSTCLTWTVSGKFCCKSQYMPLYSQCVWQKKKQQSFARSSGMLPVISTRPLSNFELTLSPDGTRVGNHRCSNLLDFNEIQTGYGFITDATKNPEIIGETSPYQYSVVMRSANSLRFYRNLNLEACLWEFTSYYDMSELLNDCGGSIGTDGQVGKKVK